MAIFSLLSYSNQYTETNLELLNCTQYGYDAILLVQCWIWFYYMFRNFAFFMNNTRQQYLCL